MGNHSSEEPKSRMFRHISLSLLLVLCHHHLAHRPSLGFQAPQSRSFDLPFGGPLGLRQLEEWGKCEPLPSPRKVQLELRKQPNVGPPDGNELHWEREW